MRRIIGALLVLMMFSTPALAKEIAGVTIPAQVKGTDGLALHLNGAGIRYKFFFKIYIAELYLQHPSTDVAKVIADNGRKRVVMHFIYHKVTKDELVDGWNEGFEANCDQKQLAALKDKIDQFNAMFTEVKSGDDIILDYLPGIGTRVIIRGQVKGVVAGKDFNDALLAIWLGKEPVSSDLRQELLGSSE